MTTLPDGWDDGGENITRLVCPDCGGSLTVGSHGPAAILFTCLVGHRYGLLELLMAKEQTIEAQLWRAVYVLQEFADLLYDLESVYVDDSSMVDRRVRARQAQQHADQLRTLLHAEQPLAFDSDQHPPPPLASA